MPRTRVILLNRYFYPDHSATSQLAVDLAREFAVNEFDVVVIASRQRYDDPEANLSRSDSIGSVQIKRVRATRFGRHGLLGRVFDYLSYSVGAFWHVLWLARRGSVVIAMTDPPMLGAIVCALLRLKRAQGINWLQDVFPEVAVRLGVLKSRLLISALTWLRDWSLSSSKVVTIGEGMAQEISKACAEPPIVIPNWALHEPDECEDPDVPAPPASQRLRAEWGLTGKFIIGYSGNMGRAHRLDGLIEAAQTLRSHSHLRLLFIGDGAHRKDLELEVLRLGLDNVIFKPYQPRESLRASLCVPDIHIVSLDERLEGLVLPSKFVGAIAVGRPVIWIGSPDGDIGHLISSADCGVIVREGDINGLSEALFGLYQDFMCGSPRLQAMGRSATLLWRERFRKRRCLDLWLDVVSRCAAEAASESG